LAIPEILQTKENIDIILLDDAFQHRPVKPTFSILLTDYNNPFFNDYVLPMGTLRESRKGARRADVIVITKCNPAISSEEKNSMTAQVHRYAPDKRVYFSFVRYGTPLPINNHAGKDPVKVIAVSGIAQSKLFERYVSSAFFMLHHFDFPDHHTYTLEDLNTIHNKARHMGSDISIVTTEKDMVKLLAFRKDMLVQWYYIPIETDFVENGPEFDATLLQTIKS
jgi:tetraacyldisaccharide 4'-kinase